MSRQALLATPTDVGQRLYEEAVPLLDHFPFDEPFRLIGMAAYDIIRPGEPVQLTLFGAPGRRKLEAAMDAVRNAFGDGAVTRAENLGREMWNAPNLDFVPDAEPEDESHWEPDEGAHWEADEELVEWE